ncbi:hypothetical protein [Amycolatopsis pithecellobii]|uniref:Uncharacterized protein n=1 Tax=Amycolatopsis pithecellobii TaxID=664692 RepID=A0A6N7ZBB3_9PSEU|nr:hypothetical protein [Amycolatopsis pithecellobii]MTD58978.1 hypothetical protein [Amycolatopsis pithecellobii]
MFAGIGIVLVTATACGQRADNVSPGAGPTPPPSVSVQPPPSQPWSAQTPPAGSMAVQAAQVDSSKLPKDYPREVFVSADGKVLYFRAEEGGCGRASADVQQETAQQIVINLRETQTNTQGRMCTMDIRYPLVSVPLHDPLGDRKILLVSLKQNR